VGWYLGATAGLPSSDSRIGTAGRASSGTRTKSSCGTGPPGREPRFRVLRSSYCLVGVFPVCDLSPLCGESFFPAECLRVVWYSQPINFPVTFMPKFKMQINSRQAVEAIRSGMSDLALMEKFALSARGLQKLFKKLVAAGELEQLEVHARLLASQQSHVVDLIISQPVQTKKARIEADKALEDIRAGVSDSELMQKYNISAKGLESLFRKLLAASLISRRELSSRRNSLRCAGTASAKEGDRGPADAVPLEAPPIRPPSFLVRLLREHRVLAAAVLGACAGVVLSAALLFLVEGLDGSLWNRRDPKKAALQAANEALFAQAQEMVAVLEAIARGDAVAASSAGPRAGSADKSECEKCMKKCEENIPVDGDVDRAMVINCKRECLSTHSERFKKIRELYH
jgi:hypothetical protein